MKTNRVIKISISLPYHHIHSPNMQTLKVAKNVTKGSKNCRNCTKVTINSESDDLYEDPNDVLPPDGKSHQIIRHLSMRKLKAI